MARNSLKNIAKLIGSATENVPVEKQFLSDLCRSIEINDKNSRRPGSNYYKPSGMQCMRNMWYVRTGQTPDESQTSYTLVGICNSGTDIHQRIQQAVLDMKKASIDCEYINVADFVRQRGLDYLEIVKEPDFEKGEYETKLLHTQLKMSFLCDGIIRYKGKYYILELKTENSSKFWTRNGVDIKHYAQATAYSVAFGLDDVMFVYISRDTLDMKAFMLPVTDKMKCDLTGILINCEDYVQKNVLPPKPENISQSVCNYCAYRSSCRKNP